MLRSNIFSLSLSMTAKRSAAGYSHKRAFTLSFALLIWVYCVSFTCMVLYCNYKKTCFSHAETHMSSSSFSMLRKSTNMQQAASSNAV